MNDDFSNIENFFTSALETNESGGQLKQPKKASLKPRVCFIITQKKSSSWVDDLCNGEMVTQNDRVYH